MNTLDAVNGTGHALSAATSVPVPPEIAAEQRELIHAVKAINPSELFGEGSELTFVLDRETRRPVVRIVDRKTKELIQQIPPEYVLRMADDLKRSRERS